MNPIHFIQLSDLHLTKNKDELVNQICPYENLKKMVEHLSSLDDPPQFVVVSGDFSEDLSKESYENAKTLLNQLPFAVYFLAGNHDHLTHLKNVLKGENLVSDKSLVLGNWQIILLNTHDHGSDIGELKKEEIAHLKKCLSEQPEHFTLIVLHHHVLSTNTPWIDQQMITNSKDFFNIISNQRNVKIVLSGHVHFAAESVQNGVHYLTCPANSYQIKQGEVEFQLSQEMPGYRSIYLYPDGTFKTSITRLYSASS